MDYYQKYIKYKYKYYKNMSGGNAKIKEIIENKKTSTRDAFIKIEKSEIIEKSESILNSILNELKIYINKDSYQLLSDYVNNLIVLYENIILYRNNINDESHILKESIIKSLHKLLEDNKSTYIKIILDTVISEKSLDENVLINMLDSINEFINHKNMATIAQTTVPDKNQANDRAQDTSIRQNQAIDRATRTTKSLIEL